MGGSDYHERITTMTAATLNVVCRDDVDESGAKVWSGLVHAAFLGNAIDRLRGEASQISYDLAMYAW